MPTHIHIEHLILEGTPLAASDSRAFRLALERELTARSVGMEARPWSSVRHVSVNAPAISPAPASLQSWAVASARSLLAAVTPTTL